MSETVRETIDRIMQQTGYYGQPVTVKAPVGDRTFYINADSPLTKNKPNNMQRYHKKDEIVFSAFQIFPQ